MSQVPFQCAVCLQVAPALIETDRQWTLLKCQACGSARLDPMPDPKLAAAGYGNEYRQRKEGKRFIALVERLIWLFHRRRFLAIRARNPAATSILDIGCGRGDLLEQFKRIHWRVLGTELNESSVAFNCQRGIDVRSGDIESLPQERFDVITMFHVLEHLPDITSTIEELEKRSQEGTQLVIEIPNALSPCHRWFGGNWFGRDLPNHLHQINPAALAQRLQERGWRLEKVHQWSWEFGFYGVGQSLANAVTPGWHNLAYRWLQTPGLRPSVLFPSILQLALVVSGSILYPLLFVFGAKRGVSEISQLWFRKK